MKTEGDYSQSRSSLAGVAQVFTQYPASILQLWSGGNTLRDQGLLSHVCSILSPLLRLRKDASCGEGICKHVSTGSLTEIVKSQLRLYYYVCHKLNRKYASYFDFYLQNVPVHNSNMCLHLLWKNMQFKKRDSTFCHIFTYCTQRVPLGAYVIR